MKRMRTLFPTVGLFLLSVAVFAQQSPSPAEDDSVYAPFVSRLTAEADGGTIKLTWQDSPDITGPVFIYRSEGAEPLRSTAGAEPLAQVPFGAESYIDRYDGDGMLHYFVVCGDTGGRKYGIAIPFGNMLSITVRRSEPEVPAAAAEQPLPGGGATISPAEAARGIGALNAEVRGDAVILSYTNDLPGKSALLYRSAQPIRGIQDLLEAVIVQAEITATPFVDYPVPGISYYYAMVYEEDLKLGALRIEPGRNATIVPVEVPAGRYRIGLPGPRADLRSMPLPLMSIHSAVPLADASWAIPAAAAPLSPEAAKAVAGLPPPLVGPGRAEKRPRAFAEDLEAPAGGEEYTLRSIVQGPFAKRDWTASTDQFEKFLSLPRTARAESRARFYLGQSFYFSNKMQDALFQFLLVQTNYPGEASEWIQAVLPRLTERSE